MRLQAGVNAACLPAWLDERAFREWAFTEIAAQANSPQDDAGKALLLRPQARFRRPHARPWSLVYPIQLADGRRLFAKASAPPLLHEARLTEMLARRAPTLPPPVLAADGARGFLLLADAGAPLRERVGQPDYLPAWRRILRQLARAQRQSAARAGEFRALGLPDRRLQRLPALFADLLERRAALCVGERDGLSENEWRRLRGMLPAFADDCARLAAYGIAPALHHDDFHDGNIFIRENGALTLADWGESALAHPFFTLRVALRYLAARLELAADAPALRALATAYLQCWGDADELRPALELALRLASVNRALTWAMLAPLTEERATRLAAAGWLREYLRMAAERTAGAR